APRLAARPDLSLGPRTAGLSADLHPLHAQASPAGVRREGPAALHPRRQLPRHAPRDRGLAGPERQEIGHATPARFRRSHDRESLRPGRTAGSDVHAILSRSTSRLWLLRRAGMGLLRRTRARLVW